MKRKSIPLIIILVLSLQSFLIISTISQNVLAETNPVTAERQILPSQGSRLDPSEYINHVPLLIDEVSDFDLFGFPGEGTQSDPYVISSLNISGSYGLTSIRVENLAVYLTIEDCFIHQGSSEYAIELFNTSHVSIEYVTIDSSGGGIHCLLANNTQIYHCQVYADIDAVFINNSNDCHLVGNYLEGIAATCNVIASASFVSENNIYEASGVGSSVILILSNNSQSVSDHINTPAVPFTVSQCADFTITDAIITGIVGGIAITDSDSPIVNHCTIYSENDYDITATNCPNVIISESTLTCSSESGIMIEDSNYTQILGNSIQSALYGILVTNSYQAVADGNIVQQGLVGIYFTYCEQSLITSNDISGCWMGGGMQWCNTSSITHNYLYNMEMGGIGSNDNFNITINDNTMNGTGRGGISLHAEDLVYGVEICRNQITNITWWAIQVSDHSDIVINNNTINNLEGDTLWFDEGMGIRMSECDNVEIEGNHISDATTGMAIASCVNVSIESNLIEEMILHGIGGVNNVNSNITDNIIEICDMGGISLGMFVDTGQMYRGPPSGTISGNILSGCGIFTDFDTFSQFAAHTYTDNTVNSKPLYYGSNVSNLNIDADLYGQIIVFNCSELNITSHDYIFDNVVIHILYSSRVLADGIHSRNMYYSFFVYQSQNLTINNFMGEYLDIYEEFDYYYLPCVSILDSTNILIENSILMGNGENTGIGIGGSSYTTIENCSIDDMGRGVWIDDSHNCTLLGNRITKMIWGIYSNYDAGDNDRDMSIIDNEIRYGSNYGIYIDNQGADNGLVQGNTVESCGTGIHIEAGENWTIQNNTIRWNDNYGIRLVNSIGANVSYNILCLSGTENGYDNLAQNWDDNVSTGNWWSDYTPPGVYPISGGAGAQDRYPMQYIVTEPIVNQVMDVQYAEDTLGNTLTWIPFDDALRDWQVTIDGVYWAGDAWNFEEITVTIDGLAYGTHTLEVTIWDVDLNSVTDDVIINVFDGTPPVISNVADGEAFVDAEGQVLTWEVSDTHPDEYHLYIDDEVVEAGSWSSGLLEVNIDGLDEGEHRIEVRIYDIDGNVASDSVRVLFIDDDVAPTIDSPDDITIEYNSVGSNIIWTPSDEHPDMYSISVNDSVTVSENWGGSRIVLSLDGLEIGTYDFELTVIDGSGLSVSDAVRVIVQSTTDDTTLPLPPTVDLGLAVIIGASAGAIVIVIVAIYLIKKRKAG